MTTLTPEEICIVDIPTENLTGLFVLLTLNQLLWCPITD